MAKYIKRKNVIFILILIFILLGGFIGIKSLDKSQLTQVEAEAVISDYLEALSNKDKEAMKQAATKEYTKSLDDDGINLLKETLKSAKLLNASLVDCDKNTAEVKSEVEIICYDNASPIGDWIPGKSISNKTFKLKKENGKWKVNDWGA